MTTPPGISTTLAGWLETTTVDVPDITTHPDLVTTTHHELGTTALPDLLTTVHQEVLATTSHPDLVTTAHYEPVTSTLPDMVTATQEVFTTLNDTWFNSTFGNDTALAEGKTVRTIYVTSVKVHTLCLV